MENLIIHLQERAALFLTNISKANFETIRDLVFNAQNLRDYFIASNLLIFLKIDPYRDNANGLALLFNDVTTKINPKDNIHSYLNVLQVSQCCQIVFDLFLSI